MRRNILLIWLVVLYLGPLTHTAYAWQYVVDPSTGRVPIVATQFGDRGPVRIERGDAVERACRNILSSHGRTTTAAARTCWHDELASIVANQKNVSLEYARSWLNNLHPGDIILLPRSEQLRTLDAVYDERDALQKQVAELEKHKDLANQQEALVADVKKLTLERDEALKTLGRVQEERDSLQGARTRAEASLAPATTADSALALQKESIWRLYGIIALGVLLLAILIYAVVVTFKYRRRTVELERLRPVQEGGTLAQELSAGMEDLKRQLAELRRWQPGEKVVYNVGNEQVYVTISRTKLEKGTPVRFVRGPDGVETKWENFANHWRKHKRRAHDPTGDRGTSPPAHASSDTHMSAGVQV